MVEMGTSPAVPHRMTWSAVDAGVLSKLFRMYHVPLRNTPESLLPSLSKSRCS
jgi:hypothetical protein